MVDEHSEASVNADSIIDLVSSLRSIGNDTSICEVKRARGGLPASIWETISAFANAAGGCILLGIDEKDDFRISGVADAGAQESQLSAICSEMEPPVRAQIYSVTIDDEIVVVCEVPQSPRDQRPCHKRSLGPWAGSRIRVSDGDRKLTDYEVGVLLSNRREQKHDLSPVPGANVDDLDSELVNAFLRRIRDTRSEIFRRVDDERALMMLNVLTSQGDQTVPTLAGLLVFGLYPQTFEPQLDITFVVYPSSEAGLLGSSGERFTENRSIDGSIPFMVAECIRLLKRNMRRRSIISGIFRTEEWEYPEEVLREALINALVHRDYSEFARGTQVQVEMYPDRLLIRNPGGLYGPVDVRSLGVTTVTSSRNKALLKILEDTPFGDGHMVCENRGTGIARMLLALTDAGMEPPSFADDIASFSAEFPNHTLLDEEALNWLGSLDGYPLTRAQMTALVMMRNGIALNNSSYRASTGVRDSRAASRDLRDLVDRRLIEQSGTRGTTVYRLIGTRTEEASLFDQPVPGKTMSPPIDLTANERAVFEVVRRAETSRASVEAATGLAYHQVVRALQSLRDKNLVQMNGKHRSRSTTWSAI
ncbi:ATP-binding protein [Actinoplanes sp. NPDC026670]|uniref:ATP-binding protein n=1 Tax=Actinoplanes sp. NPDC026670 TaxID=3154700 RepID=UPI003401FAC4